MKRVNVAELTGEEILAIPVIKDEYSILVQSDTILNDHYIKKLREFNIKSVYIKNDSNIKAQYKVEETIKDAQKVVNNVYKHHIYKYNNDLKDVVKQAECILTDILNQPEVIKNVTEIRNISNDLYSHSVNVSAIATIMAVRLNMTDNQIRNVAIGAILHDIGLKFIQYNYTDEKMHDNDDSVSEYRKHTIYGYSSLEEEEWLSNTAKEIILLHHERCNGTGFPFKLNKTKIKPEVRLVSISDFFDEAISGIGIPKMKIYQAIEYLNIHKVDFYDIEMVNKVIETFAVYPIGTTVITNENEKGIVIKQNKGCLSRPILLMKTKSNGDRYDKEVVKDLSKILTVFIVDTV